MGNKSSGRVWPLSLIAAAAIGTYFYLSVDFTSKASDTRATGGVEDLAALADQDDTNVLFILVDTLRAERMSAYGYERDTTPFLSKLAATGIRFDHHIAQSSWTKSSMASLWTSLNPIRSGVTKFNHAISSEATMPAEIMSEAGFKTVGLYRNGWVHGYFGFDQGFDKYYRPMGNLINKAIQQMRPNVQAHGTDESLIGDAIEFLRIHGKSSRWFLYMHLMDLHEYTYDEESALFGNTVSDLYDNSILRTDWIISKLYEFMTERGLLENTIVVVLSDPENVDALATLADLAALQGDSESALAGYDKVLELASDNLQAVLGRLHLLAETEQRAEGIQTMVDYINRGNPYEGRAALALALVLDDDDLGRERRIDLTRRAIRFGAGKQALTLLSSLSPEAAAEYELRSPTDISSGAKDATILVAPEEQS